MWNFIYKSSWSFNHRSAYQYTPLHYTNMEKPRKLGFKGFVQKLVRISRLTPPSAWVTELVALGS
jgi:hypothetical protein